MSFVIPDSAAAQQAPIPIYVTPFYNSEGPTIDVGPFSKELAAATPATAGQLAAALQQQLATLPAVTMYVAAVRLYDLGQRDEALYWFYRAQYRARLFQRVLDGDKIGSIGSPAFELRSAHGAFQELAGEYLNGYAGCDQARWLAVLAQVRQENQAVPNLAAIYPLVAFKPKDQWAAQNTETNHGLGELATYIQKNWADFQAKRQENSMDKRFCK